MAEKEIKSRGASVALLTARVSLKASARKLLSICPAAQTN